MSSRRRSRRRMGCPNCGDFDWDQLQSNPFDVFFSYPDKIAHTASEGCATCGILLRSLQHCYPYVFDKPEEYRLAFHGFEGPMRWDLFHPGEDIRAVSRTNRFIELFSRRDDYCPWDEVGAADHFNFDLENAIQQAHIWLESCRNSHPKCAVQYSGTLPSRVVRIIPQSNPADPLNHPKVKLHETTQGETGQYITLSHCWGKNPIITTKTTNIDQYKNEIPWGELSKTFQEAIIFAGLMGVESIWIDSLCIIQNSAEDWSAEAVKMASYYCNSEFTIAATASTDGAGGLYHPTPLVETAIEIEGFDPKTQSEFRVGVRRPLAHLHDALEDRTKIVDRFPLLSRGWVYQERVLSRRFLHFGPREVHWECHEEVNCQCGGGKAALEMNPSGAETSNQALAITEGKLAVDKIMFLWLEQIENLTSLNFTHISDQLPALSGIATLMRQSQQPGRYLAGLWEEGLLFWLCWATQKSGQPRTLKDTPSWSWASIQGHISFSFIEAYFMKGPWGQAGHDNMLLVNAAQVSMKQCVPSNPSLSGKLEEAVLKVDGLVAPVTLNCRQDQGSGEEVFGFCLKYQNAASSGDSAPDICYPFQWDITKRDYLTCLDGKPALLLHFLSYEKLEAAYEGPDWMRSFLIVRPVDEMEARYERVGILCTDVTGGFLPSKAWIALGEKQKSGHAAVRDEFLQYFRTLSNHRTLDII
ncbi:HET domain-containing protein [Fusarium keratoplasticum]|uniref:HET domain-containing protein n=1 Tax=Fusarium keratoplasticum TaxID=1328300 RepID=A0ACC0R3I0_9HYPO|nr:HET domain-containing protein [Fusarium keratoplasticum]KAI8674653.1 HET domain-containing protein [Fusarium keratoplasticum]